MPLSVFDRFYRLDKSRSRNIGGGGLGLAIVKKIAEDHGRLVIATSIPGEGGNFLLILPSLSPYNARALAGFRLTAVVQSDWERKSGG